MTDREPLSPTQVRDAFDDHPRLREAILHAMEHGWVKVYPGTAPGRHDYVLTEEGKNQGGAT